MRASFFVILLALSVIDATWASDIPWIDPDGISGAILLSGGKQPSSSVVRKFSDLAGGRASQIIVVAPIDNAASALADVIPGTIIDCGPLDHRRREELIAAIAKRPKCVAFHLADGAAVAIHGRRIDVLGEGPVTVLLAASTGRSLLEIQLRPGARHDLTMLRRAALERSLASFPPQVLPPPMIENGSLLIHGGGEVPPDIVQRFIDLAGGKDAPIVVLPIAAEGSLPEETSRDTRLFTRSGATNVTTLRARQREEVMSPEFAEAVTKARGVWFHGGRQWRFVDAYLGTGADELFQDVLRRGGVIGGSSAGASIQSQYMPRGSPLGNTDMMAEGYERGLGFLPGAAVDQHFTQRRRHADMTNLMRRWPQFLGIGIDESTAILVRGHTAELVGRGNVHFYDYRTGPPAGEHDFTAAKAGERYDLVERRLIAPQSRE
jgi:cyanophycinase